MNDDVDFSDFNEYIPQHDDYEHEAPEEEAKVPLPCSFDGIDLQRPPGFVGRVADWIDSQCRYPRRKLAVASAIVGVGNIAGLRHSDARDGITANILAFCVAASSTGKEAVMQAFADLHITAGVQGAMHGSIKSEQEIARNIIDQQASFYNVDEIGIFMTKVRNAQKRGGSAAYLEGIFGSIMSIYSKANSRYLLGGDTKRELRKVYTAQVARLADDGDDDGAARAQRKLDMIESGLERPFMSVVGYTTPSTFDGIMDGETATQGLLGRAIVINEKDINPKPRKGFKRAQMPMTMAMRLMSLYGHEERLPGACVEWRDDLVSVPTDREANDLLDGVLDWLIAYADEMNEATGEASVAMVRRAYEMVAKVSFILAIPEGVRTVEHVKWAFAYVRAEMEYKIRVVFANDNSKHDPEKALAARIETRLDSENWMTLSVLKNKLRVDEAALLTILDRMVDAGIVAQKTGKRTYNGRKVVSYRLSE